MENVSASVGIEETEQQSCTMHLEFDALGNELVEKLEGPRIEAGGRREAVRVPLLFAVPQQ